MFLSGLRRSEVFALKPCDLDWDTPKINVCKLWQRFGHKDKTEGPPKGKRERKAPFDPILQEAIKNLWVENRQHEYIHSFKRQIINGEIQPVKTPGSSWISQNFKRWLRRAGIVLHGRKIVPHSSRLSLATLLEKRGVPLRYIQELLGHSDMKNTKTYLVESTDTIRDVGLKISEVMKKSKDSNILEFKVS